MLKAIRTLSEWFFKALEMGKTYDEIEKVEGFVEFMKSKLEPDYKTAMSKAMEKIKASLGV